MRKDKLSNRERRLARMTHLEEYIAQFLRIYSSPTQRWLKLEEALEEVTRERLLLSAELDEDFPHGRIRDRSSARE